IEYGKLENSQKWFYTSIPVYDLFSKKISEEILSAGNSENYYSTTYSFNWRRRFSNTVKDFYLPQAANLSLSRDIRTTDSISDLYQIKSTLTCMSVNIFGSNGNTPVFNFFESDEYTLSLTSAIKIPADKLQDTQLQLSAYGSMLLYISNKNVVKAGFDLTVDTNANWLLRTSASWNRNSRYSLLTFIPSFLFENFSTENLKIQRKEIMNFTAGSTDGISKITAEYSHKCDLNFLTNYWITTDLTGTFGYTEASIFRMGLEYSLGGKITF
ncbi:MAG: hypothetical protein MJ162_06675, partial [Treponema sp.]|nr:hypothetical protein [Treponema sp.]